MPNQHQYPAIASVATAFAAKTLVLPCVMTSSRCLSSTTGWTLRVFALLGIERRGKPVGQRPKAELKTFIKRLVIMDIPWASFEDWIAAYGIFTHLCIIIQCE